MDDAQAHLFKSTSEIWHTILVGLMDLKKKNQVLNMLDSTPPLHSLFGFLALVFWLWFFGIVFFALVLWLWFCGFGFVALVLWLWFCGFGVFASAF
jgi:hypothetical protein